MRLAIAFILFFSFGWTNIYAQQNDAEDIVQINGVTMTADSLRAVPNVTILVKDKYRGVQSNERGVFSIVVRKGDVLQFSSVGYKSKDVVIPENIKGHYFSMIQLMVQDTFYLPETVIRPIPTRDQFDYAFKNSRVPDDKYERARKNTNAYTMRVLAYTLPRDGRESQSMYQNMQATQAVYYGQQRPTNFFSPLAWAEFFEAWKRGDFRKKRF